MGRWERRIGRVAAALLILLLGTTADPFSASAQQAVNQAKEDPIDGPGPIGFGGIILDSATGQPIPYARITLVGAPSPIEVVTDQTGGFRTPTVARGTSSTWLK